MTPERKPSEIAKKKKLEKRLHIDMAGSDESMHTFKDLEPLHPPTEADIEQKKEVIKRKKR